MKTKPFTVALVALFLAFIKTNALQAQGTVTFNSPWMNDGTSYFGLGYFDGIAFRLGTPPPHDGMVHIGATGPAGYPHNGTPYVAFINTLGTAQSVLLIRTNLAVGQPVPPIFTAGAPFGLVSVDLADPVAPSLSPIDITFNGFLTDNSMVSQTFTVGGGGSSSFQTFSFGPDFAHGLVRVEIPSPAWAMDNLVWIPEPGTGALLGLGLLALMFRKLKPPANGELLSAKFHDRVQQPRRESGTLPLKGYWTVIHDCEVAGQNWQKVSWNAFLTNGCTVDVCARGR